MAQWDQEMGTQNVHMQDDEPGPLETHVWRNFDLGKVSGSYPDGRAGTRSASGGAAGASAVIGGRPAETTVEE